MNHINHINHRSTSSVFSIDRAAETINSRQSVAAKSASPKSGKSVISSDFGSEEVWMLLTQAGICCEEARHAAGRRRYRAACGLFSTAIVLYKMLLREGGAVRDPELRRQIEEQMQHISNERDVHSNLCSQWRRP